MSDDTQKPPQYSYSNPTGSGTPPPQNKPQNTPPSPLQPGSSTPPERQEGQYQYSNTPQPPQPQSPPPQQPRGSANNQRMQQVQERELGKRPPTPNQPPAERESIGVPTSSAAARVASYRQDGNNSRRHADEIEYDIRGYDIQFVEILLDPEESVIAENGAMMFFDTGVQMDTKLSDGSKKGSGMMGSVLGAAKRSFAGETMFLSYFTNRGKHKATVGFSAPYPGMIIPIDLSYSGGKILCQKGAFICGAKGISVSIGFTKRLSAGMFGGEGFILQKIEGDGIAFVHAGGSIRERTLRPGEKIFIDVGCIVAFEGSVEFNIKVVTGVKNIFFGNENLFLATLQGPGKVWIQSMPFNELVANIYQTILGMSAKERKKGTNQKK